MTIQTSMLYQVVYNSLLSVCTSSSCSRKMLRTTLSQVQIEILVLTKKIHTGHRQGFRCLNEFCTRNTLLQTKDKIHETGAKSGSYHYCDHSCGQNRKQNVFKRASLSSWRADWASALHLPTRGPRVGARGCFSISWVGS